MHSADGGQLIERLRLQGNCRGVGWGTCADARWGKYRRGWPVGVRDEGGVEGHYRERRGLSSSSFIADSILPASLWQMDFHNAETM